MKSLARALAASCALAACFLISPSAMADMMKFMADLKPQSEVPPTDSKGMAKADIMVDTATKKLSWTIDYGGLTGEPTAAHFHGPAKPGENAGPTVNISGNIKKGTADLTGDQLQQLQAGNWYVNIHTEKYPKGEIRGQVEAAK